MRYVARQSLVVGDERALKRVDGVGKDRGRGRRSGYLDSNHDLRRPSGECRRESWAITVAIRQLCPKARARRSNPDERELRGRDSNPDNQLQRLASCRLDDPALGLVRIADRTGFGRFIGNMCSCRSASKIRLGCGALLLGAGSTKGGAPLGRAQARRLAGRITPAPTRTDTASTSRTRPR